MSEERPLARLRTALEVAFEVSGPEDGIPVTFLHGFPDDPRTWDRTVSNWQAPVIAQSYPMRGYGPTRFLSDATLRSGQQAALEARSLNAQRPGRKRVLS
jgi:pimeloyl-ACP methyl ester carboxylesterase